MEFDDLDNDLPDPDFIEDLLVDNYMNAVQSPAQSSQGSSQGSSQSSQPLFGDELLFYDNDDDDFDHGSQARHNFRWVATRSK